MKRSRKTNWLSPRKKLAIDWSLAKQTCKNRYTDHPDTWPVCIQLKFAPQIADYLRELEQKSI